VFNTFLEHLDKALPFEKLAGLANESLQKKLYAFSQGNMRSLRNLIYQASIEAIDNQHATITEADFVFASKLTSGDKPILWKNPFDKGVKVTEDMLRPPPKGIGWEDYYRNVKPENQRRKGNNIFE
ncbi:transposase, partial [Vibrio cholerae]|nr:transposase [Vibrio cholerae]